VFWISRLNYSWHDELKIVNFGHKFLTYDSFQDSWRFTKWIYFIYSFIYWSEVLEICMGSFLAKQSCRAQTLILDILKPFKTRQLKQYLGWQAEPFSHCLEIQGDLEQYNELKKGLYRYWTQKHLKSALRLI